MKIYIDTANLEEIRKAADLGIIDGVTTNPSIISREKVQGMEQTKAHFAKICEIMHGNISAEVIATDYDGMIEEAHQLISIDPRIVVKIPATQLGIRVIHHLTEQGVKTNCTLVFSLLQALAAMKAGATYVSPFVGRLEDQGIEGLQLIRKIMEMKRMYGYTSEIICASVRTKHHIKECIALGADVVTCPYEFILTFFQHHLTEAGLAQFLSDYKNQ